MSEQLTLIPPEPYRATAYDACPLDALADQVVNTPLDPALAASLRRYGQLVPVALYLADGEALVIADGRRRVRALIEIARQDGVPLDRATVDARFYPTRDQRFGPLATLVCNNQRSASALAELEAIEALMARGMDPRAIAHETCIRLGTIYKRLALADLLPELRDILKAGGIAVGVAQKAAALPAALQERLLDVYAAKGSITGADVRRMRQVQIDRALDQLALAPTPDAGGAACHLSDRDLMELIAACERGDAMLPNGLLAAALDELLERRRTAVPFE